ncbi:hypothetical protein [Mesorhizobium sp. M1365]|uniref:hypothetical protein n=1 Tax=Mesorhizobium sp. M1365 TaxID=2957090 RepID=UPI00333AD84B
MSRAQPTCQPKAVAGRLICDGDPLDRIMPGLAGFVAPALQQLQQWCVGIDLLEGLTLEARYKRGNQPFRLLIYGDDRVILFKSG